MYYLAVSLLPPTGEPELYCTSFVRGPTTDDGSVEVELQNGTFRFLTQSYTSVFVSLSISCVTLIHYISSQVNSNGHVSLNRSFTNTAVGGEFFPLPIPLFGEHFPPLLAPLYGDVDPSRGGLVLYRETQDPQLISRYANEVSTSTAFPNQPTFNPESLFIATWFHVPSISRNEVS